MSKTKSSEIPHYELLYLISNEWSEDEVGPISEKVKNAIASRGGKITYSEDWGKKRLAYPIKGFAYGYYLLLEFDLPGGAVVEVDRDLRMMREILRQQIIARPARTAEEIAKEKEAAKKIAAKSKEQPEEAPKAEIKKEKFEMGDLDKKLDKILETDDLI